MKYNGHKYTWEHPFSSTRHLWELRGPSGAIHFHVSIMDEIDKYPEPSCGLEFHHAFDPTNGENSPDHINCPLTGGRCWHEGTSLYAVESVWPMVKVLLEDGDHAGIFRYLEHEYDKHFSEFEKKRNMAD